MDDTHYREAICPACGIIDRFGDKWSLRILFSSASEREPCASMSY